MTPYSKYVELAMVTFFFSLREPDVPPEDSRKKGAAESENLTRLLNS